MRSIWQNQTLSIVIFPGTDGNDIYEVMREWTIDRLISPFLWIKPEAIELHENQPPKVLASVFGRDELGDLKEITVDLFQELARHEFDVVRLLAVRALRTKEIESDIYRSTVTKFARYVENSLPLPSSRDEVNVERTKLYKINLLVAPTEAHQESFKSTILDNWNLNVIASPEDRSTPWSGDAFVRDDEKFARFVAMHTATTAGLWNGLSHGPFEILERENSQQGTIWVSRVFVNSVMTDGLSRRVAAKALAEIGNPESDTYDPLIGVSIPDTVIIPDQNSSQWINWMVDEVFKLDKAALTFVNPMEEEEPAKELWYEWEQIKNFLQFSWDKLKAIPWWMWIWVRRLVGRLLTNIFQRAEGKAVVGISQLDPMDSRDSLIKEKIDGILQLGDQARKALVTPHLSSLTKSNPTLWNGIRKLAFSMLDASNRNDFIPSDGSSKIPVFSRVSQVISDPRKSWKIEEPLATTLGISEIAWHNQENLDDVKGAYDAHLFEMRSEKDQLIEELLQIESKMNEVLEGELNQIISDVESSEV